MTYLNELWIFKHLTKWRFVKYKHTKHTCKKKLYIKKKHFLFHIRSDSSRIRILHWPGALDRVWNKTLIHCKDERYEWHLHFDEFIFVLDDLPVVPPGQQPPKISTVNVQYVNNPDKENLINRIPGVYISMDIHFFAPPPLRNSSFPFHSFFSFFWGEGGLLLIIFFHNHETHIFLRQNEKYTSLSNIEIRRNGQINQLQAMQCSILIVI